MGLSLGLPLGPALVVVNDMDVKWLLIGWLLLAAGCQSTASLPTANGPTPAELSASADPTVKGRRFTWGGTIVSVKNLADRTLLEIMAYPLDRKGRPRTDERPLGRFIADRKGFLEPMNYAPGRRVTVTGPMLGYTDGRVGEAPYRYPALQADKLELWPDIREGFEQGRRPDVHLGIGAGSWGGNIGISIGL